MNLKLKEKKRRGRYSTSDKDSLATTRILTRILIILKNKNYCNKTFLVDNAGCSDGQKILDGLNWLINHNLVSEIKNNQTVYCLKEKENLIKELIKIEERLK